MNKHNRLKDCVKTWRQRAKEAGSRGGTTVKEDQERRQALEECADEVEKVLDDHTAD